MDCIDLTSKRSKMFKTFNTTQNNKSDQITTNCIDLMSKKSKERKTTKLRPKTTKVIKLQWIGSIWCQNDQNNAKLQTRSNYDQFASIWHLNYQKCWVTSQNIQINAKQRKWSYYNYCIDMTSKRSKLLS